ncbi:Serine/threonine-protein phosphatase 2 [bioreactor metagenome]|uniref:Serine/threonine-protein phosphatase 2 n=1 Tax=bioreactor metagenome TaxID=1076179 RepID=A0A644W9U3_9ZZZZ
MSDIHGEFYKYKKMLEKIEFSDADTLYILGDVIDRGKYSMRTLLHIMRRPNIKMLLGNHEIMMMRSMQRSYFNCWMGNGGYGTLHQFEELSEATRKKIDKYLAALPLTIELDGYILVHAGITATRQDEEFCVWAREEFLSIPTGLNKTVIFGHTPTSFMVGKKLMTIWHGDGRIGIDCGACFKGGQLGCLRLDDMKEYYV